MLLYDDPKTSMHAHRALPSIIFGRTTLIEPINNTLKEDRESGVACVSCAYLGHTMTHMST